MKNYTTLLISFLVSISSLYAQKSNSKNQFNTWSVGAGLSTLHFLGDVKQNDFLQASFGDFNELRYGANLNVTKQLNYLFGLEGQANIGQLAGFRNGYVGYTDVKFEADFNSVDLSLKMNISNLIFDIEKYSNSKFQINGGIGLGMMKFRSILTLLRSDTIVDLEGYVDYPFAVVSTNAEEKAARFANYYKYFLNVNYALSRKLELSLNFTKNQTLTNSLDVAYSSPDDSYTNKEDGYFATSLGVKYNIGRAKKNLQWYNPLGQTFHSQKRIRKQIQGLRKDSDNDGVADQFDNHPNTPENIAVDGMGVPLDVDMDGVFDYQDADPFSAPGVTVDENGLELDSDGDGVGDSRDQDSNTKEGVIVNQYGVEITNFDGSTFVMPSIYFSSSSSTIKEEDLKSLAIIAKVLKANPDLKLNVIGHTDSNGSIYLNNELGLKRAKSVRQHLIDVYSIKGDRLVCVSKGETMPLVITPNANLENANSELSTVDIVQGINRRVDFEQFK
ncbi:MAG: OmpA family protein [Flavobacteriales bacterium]